jgi:hypothetical protein
MQYRQISPRGQTSGARRGPGAGLLILCVACAGLLAPVSRAQEGSFKQGQPNPEARTKLPSVQNVWENAAEFQNAAALAEFDSYFQQYLFPAMAVSTADGLRELGGHRDRLMRLLERPVYPQIYERLTGMTLEAMKAIATDNYHPAARYNAMLVIGSLDQTAGDPSGAGTPPVPLPAAADFLIQQLQSSSSDVLKLGALIGLERHAQIGLPEEKRAAVTDELIKMVTSERPGDRTVEFHSWLQFRAAHVLAQLKSLGENNRVHDALIGLLNSDSVSVVDRVHVAQALSYLKDLYTPEAGIDGAATVAAFGNVLADVIEEEDKEAFKFNEQQRSGGFAAFGAYGSIDGEPPKYPRGRLLQRIGYLLDGFAAVEPALSDELRQQVQAVRTAVEELRAAALDRNNNDVDLTIKIEALADQIVDSASDLGESAAPAADPEAGSGDDQGLDVLGTTDSTE